MCDHAPHADSTPTECSTPVATEVPTRPREITIELIAGLPRQQLIQRIHYHQRQGEVSERALGFYLLDLDRRKMYRPLESTSVWAQKNLPKQERTDKLILLARRLEKLPQIRAAFDSGKVPWTKIREIARIARADTEQVWLDAARKMTSRQLEAEVSGKKRGDRPGGGLKARRTKEEVKLRLPGRDLAIWEKAIRLVRREKPDLTPDAAGVEIARRVLQMSAGGTTTGKEKPHGLDTVIVLHRWPDGGSAVDTERGRLPVDPEVIEEAIRAGARTIEVKEVEGPGVCSAIPFGERGKVAPEDRDAAVSPELKEAVIARDGHCVVCGRFDELSPHHLDSHADGGKSDMTRLVTLCLWCQGYVHAGDVVLRVEEDGTVTALDRDGDVIGKPRTAAEVLGEADEVPLEVIERGTHPGAEAAPESGPDEDEPPEIPTLDSLSDLPGTLTASQWRALEGLIECTQGRLVFRPDGRALSDLLDLREEAAPLPSGEAGGGDPAAPVAGPGSFDDFVGQRRAVENLLLAARAAKQRGEALDHVLLSGQPGIGKTSIGRLLARECGADFVEVLAGSISDPHQLLSLLTHLRPGGVLLLDEIHSLPEGCRTFLYSALQENVVDVVLREGTRSQKVRVRLEPFTLVGATTELGEERPSREL